MRGSPKKFNFAFNFAAQFFGSSEQLDEAKTHSRQLVTYRSLTSQSHSVSDR